MLPCHTLLVSFGLQRLCALGGHVVPAWFEACTEGSTRATGWRNLKLEERESIVSQELVGERERGRASRERGFVKRQERSTSTRVACLFFVLVKRRAVPL